MIPARLDSTRFPKKVLANLGDRPLLDWVFEAAIRCDQFDHVTFAIDSDETALLLEKIGAPYVMTSKECPSGTKRLIECVLSTEVESDIWVNWQADEPFIGSEMIDELLQSDDGDIWTLKQKITDQSELEDPNVVKVVTDRFNHALYFSRHTIPFVSQISDQTFYKHIGLYAFSQRAVEMIATHPVSDIEVSERLEQLTFLYEGLKISVHETEHSTVGIDTKEDLAQAIAMLG